MKTLFIVEVLGTEMMDVFLLQLKKYKWGRERSFAN